MRLPFFALIVGAALLLPSLTVVTQAADDPAGQPGAVAYPGNPSATPQADSNGAPVVTDKAACPSGTKCPDKPAPSAQADTGTTGTAQSGGVRTPSTAYPDSPVKTPAAEPTGTAPN